MGAFILLDLFVFLFGVCIFSFLNAAAYRLPRQISFVKGSSFCPHCQHSLQAKDLIPLLSWLLLKGRCRYCRAAISVRYFIIELWGGILALLCLHYFASYLEAFWVLTFFALLTLITLIDLDIMEIPNILVGIVFIWGIFTFFLNPEMLWWERLLGVIAVSLPLFLITLIIPNGFGGGDIKLMAACGLALGYKLILMAFFLAVVAGGLYGIYLLLTRKKGRKEHFAFGPFLCLGIFIAFFWGEALLNWYLGFILT